MRTLLFSVAACIAIFSQALAFGQMAQPVYTPVLGDVEPLTMRASLKDLFGGTGVIDRHQAVSETPRVSRTTGFRWGGLIRSQDIHTSRVIDFYQNLRFVYSLNSGSYVYTVFSKNGNGQATNGVNLVSTEAAITWDIVRKRASLASVRHLLRDGAGQWYISNPQPLDSSAEAQRLETVVSSIFWYRLDSVHTLRMNHLEEEVEAVRQERNLSWSQIPMVPDLSCVTGGGLYIENGWDDYHTGGVNITEIKSVEWRSGLPELVVETTLGAFVDGQGFGPDLPDTREVFLINTGKGILQISSLTIEDKSGRFSMDKVGPLSLAMGERAVVHVTYDPAGDPGMHQTRLAVKHNAAGVEESITSVALIGRPLVDHDFPGGNIIVDRVEGPDLYMRPDLRDTPSYWFYWCFRIRGAQNQTLYFHFNENDPGRIATGARGPAFSRDGGVTWEWLGTHPNEFPFPFAFGPDDTEVLFSSVIPYWESHLQQFLQKHEGSPHLQREVLTISRKGREVERLRLGRLDGNAAFRFFLTSGHHACEMMGMYMLEGVMEAILEDSEAGRWMRSHVEMLAVPFVDKDGVEDGDQGKSRAPYDHVGDYREDPLYPETAAIMDFVPGWAGENLELALDLHCPYLRGGYHEVLMTPVRLRGPEEEWLLVEEFLAVLEKVQAGPLQFRLIDSQEFGSWGGGPNAERAPYGASQFSAWARRTFPGITAAALEIPYANVRWNRDDPAGDEVNQETARLFGRDLGQAIYTWLKAKADAP